MTDYAAPPIKYQYICPAVDGCYYAPASGSLKFKIINRRTSYIFVYVTESNPYREVKGVSEIVSYSQKDLYSPMNVHIAASNDIDCGTTNSCIQIMWIQKEINNPMIKYGKSATNLKWSILTNTFSNITSDDYCGQSDGLPAGTYGYFDFGILITGYLLTLEPDTMYFYQFSIYFMF